MKLIFVRHGETFGNAEGVILGQHDGHYGQLNAIGIKQAKNVANKLKFENIDAIYSSDLSRAKDTVFEIAKYHKGIKISLLKELRERYYGADEGKKLTKEEREERAKILYNLNFRPGGGETVAELYNRIFRILDSIYKENIDNTVLIVGHAGMGRIITAISEEINLDEIGSKVSKAENTEIRIFEIKKLQYLGNSN